MMASKKAAKERILGKDKAAHEARIVARSEQFEALMEQWIPSNVAPKNLGQFYQTNAEIDAVQETLAGRFRALPREVFLLANEHIFGGPDGSIYIAGCTDICRGFSQSALSMRSKAQEKYDCATARLGYTRMIEINLAEDKKLQKVINVFGAMLESIEQETYKDPYWMLARFVDTLFGQNPREKEDFKSLNEEEQFLTISVDDKTFSGQNAIKIGDMFGSSHSCAPMAITVKIIADFFKMPCRVVFSDDHVFNLVLDRQNQWKALDVAQLNFQGKMLSVHYASPAIPLDKEDVYDYSKVSGNKAMSPEIYEEEQSVVDAAAWRMLPITPDLVEPIKYSKVLEDLQGFIRNNAVQMLPIYVDSCFSAMMELKGIEGALAEGRDRSRKKELQVQKWGLNLRVEQMLNMLVRGFLEDKQLHGPLVEWLRSDPDRKLYLESIGDTVRTFGEKHAKEEVVPNSDAGGSIHEMNDEDLSNVGRDARKSQKPGWRRLLPQCLCGQAGGRYAKCDREE